MSTHAMISNWMKETLESYIAQLALSKSQPTVEAYRYDIAKWLQYLYERNIRRISSIKPSHVIDYLGQCKAMGKSDASVNRYYMALRSFCRWLRKSRYISVDLTEDISAPKAKQKAPRIPSIEEISAILKAPNIETESGTRDRAILELLYSSGLRASELCDLALEDYKGDSIVVKCGKRGKTRTVPVTTEAANAIEEYVKRYRGKQSGFLFVTMMRKRIRRQLLGEIVSDYAKKAKVEGITTHTLRHACATHLLDNGADLRLIQEVLGHSSIASTQRYTHLSSNKMREMFMQHHPRKKNNELDQDTK